MAALAEVTLDDKYTRARGRVFLNGIQALVRLPMLQRQRDLAAGLNTAGFVSGYRGSPLGGLDLALWRAQRYLDEHHVRFQPAINEDLGATAVWGSQQVNLFAGARYDGVFAMWYGKGPGVDRSGDVLKHGNAAGSSKHGGVLVIAGDDHACKSSTLPHQSEYAFMAAEIPVLNPAGVREILPMGLLGFALSRYSGCWVGFKTIAETVDSSATIEIDVEQPRIVLPEDFDYPQEGLHIRWPDPPLQQEMRLQRQKLYAALAFARANNLNQVVVDSPHPRLGIVTTGKSYLDVCQALEDLGIDLEMAADIGLRVLKVGMSWPLERETVRDFARGLDEVLVVEEKRAVIENQLKEQLYNWREDVRPRVIGKFDERGEWILPSTSELTPARIARVIAARITRFFDSDAIHERLDFLKRKEEALARPRALLERVPHFCSGCPHNTSTRVPEGSRAMAGIGCHYMATWMDRSTQTFTQMGGEGVPWIGQAPFTETEHVFANLGDGTYFHSGILAIRATLAARVNITFKILYNDAVAMTGGQPLEGSLSVAQITHQLYGEGVRRIAVVLGDEDAELDRSEMAQGVTTHVREEFEQVQRELREHAGTSVLVYVQTCAAEKRRRRKRGVLADPPKRAFINHLVCETCGDCSVQSNCLSVVPLATEFGVKRAIDQSSCNKDFSCVDGFCPSFVTVHGGELRKPAAQDPPGDLPAPPAIALDETYNVVITGVGGTGVVTIGALLGMAAHLENKGCTVLDMTGLAQKFGAVVSHTRIAARPDAINTVRIPAGEAHLLLGCDLVVAAGFDALSKVDSRYTHAVINSHEAMTAQFIRARDMDFSGAAMPAAIGEAVGQDKAHFIDATKLATALCGDAIATNLFMVGFAYQKGLLPLSDAALQRAIELNGVAVESNKRAFAWGRYCAHDPDAVKRAAGDTSNGAEPGTLTGVVEHRAAHLAAYQNAAYAGRYSQLVERVRELEQRVAGEATGLATAVARNYAKLLAYKDEYEVARLYSDGRFRRAVERQFAGDFRLKVHLAPPLLARPDARGRPRKRTFGPWMLRLFGLLARGKMLRGTRLDPFGYQAERRLERQLIADYEALIEHVCATLSRDNHAAALALAELPGEIRGFGPIKLAAIAAVKQKERALREAYDKPPLATAA